ncbi:MAG: GIY-YIG nuclease family protein [Candidatus Komeilibacteria bacterium]|nr:GIY-YIG nuclease family protein [Candidatus Komeilibacteria bacterium]
MYYVYVLQSLREKTLYTGFTRTVKKRLLYHNNGSDPYTTKFKPWILVYYEAYLLKEDAINREKFLKSGSGKKYLDKQLREYFRKNPRRKL